MRAAATRAAVHYLNKERAWIEETMFGLWQ